MLERFRLLLRYLSRGGVWFASLIASSVLGVGAEPSGAKSASEGLAFFESRIRPVLVERCYGCHSHQAKSVKGGLYLDTRSGTLQGGESGHAVVPEQPNESLLLAALRYEGLEMPPDGRLSEKVVQDFVDWIAMGAPDPREDGAPTLPRATINLAAGRSFWAFQPVHDPPVPQVDSSWPLQDVDRFLWRAHQQAGVQVVEDAAPAKLLRRVYFDLIGLPPSPDEIESFLRDPSPEAYRGVVDRLLESPAFGERWGRHWLDVVRYAESTGKTRNYPFPFAWRYRDYVINALNRDLPYDQFVREQLAGDLLPTDDPEERDRLQIATGFLALGAVDLNERNRELYRMDLVGEQLDVLGRAFLGLTVGCARCHDHKFDPIPLTDYYALAGILRSTETRNGYDPKRRNNQSADPDLYVPLSGRAAHGTVTTETDIATRSTNFKSFNDASHYAMGVQEGRRIADCPVHEGGEVERLGPTIPRGFLQVIALADTPRIPNDASGRRELADWIARPDHPLTARVMVNRIWHHLFGRGLVPTVDNFGAMGQAPSHPELLDYLAARFVEQHWSVKQMIRMLVTSHAYQLSDAYSATNYAIDGDNQWLWRMPARRLEAEAIRDAVLQISGALSTTPPDGSPLQSLPIAPLRRRADLDQRLQSFPYRTVYVPIVRTRVPEYLTAFDFPEPSDVKGSRDVTTVATQALFMLNSPFVELHCRLTATRLLQQRLKPRPLVREAYLLTLGRLPTEEQTERALDYLRIAQRDSAEPPRAAAVDALAELLQALIASAEFRYR